jgi:hypothetical protein
MLAGRAGSGRKALLVCSLAGLLVGGIVGIARPNHLFSDVPTAAIYHDAVSWLAARGVTLGCAAGLYCPNEFVTRAQMALFMQRLGTALTPRLVPAEGSGAFDPDLNPVICQTIAYMPAFPQLARIDSLVSMLPAGTPMAITTRAMVSTNGGASWSPATASPLIVSAPGTVWFQAAHQAFMELAAGTTYHFGIGVSRQSGAEDVTSSNCRIDVWFTHHNPVGESTTIPAAAPRAPRTRR